MAASSAIVKGVVQPKINVFFIIYSTSFHSKQEFIVNTVVNMQSSFTEVVHIT